MLTEMVLQSPSRKLRSGVRKLSEAVWMKSLSAAPRRFSASDTLSSVFPAERVAAEQGVTTEQQGVQWGWGPTKQLSKHQCRSCPQLQGQTGMLSTHSTVPGTHADT